MRLSTTLQAQKIQSMSRVFSLRTGRLQGSLSHSLFLASVRTVDRLHSSVEQPVPRPKVVEVSLEIPVGPDGDQRGSGRSELVSVFGRASGWGEGEMADDRDEPTGRSRPPQLQVLWIEYEMAGYQS